MYMKGLGTCRAGLCRAEMCGAGINPSLPPAPCSRPGQLPQVHRAVPPAAPRPARRRQQRPAQWGRPGGRRAGARAKQRCCAGTAGGQRGQSEGADGGGAGLGTAGGAAEAGSTGAGACSWVGGGRWGNSGRRGFGRLWTCEGVGVALRGKRVGWYPDCWGCSRLVGHVLLPPGRRATYRRHTHRHPPGLPSMQLVHATLAAHTHALARTWTCRLTLASNTARALMLTSEHQSTLNPHPSTHPPIHPFQIFPAGHAGLKHGTYSCVSRKAKVLCCSGKHQPTQPALPPPPNPPPGHAGVQHGARARGGRRAAGG